MTATVSTTGRDASESVADLFADAVRRLGLQIYPSSPVRPVFTYVDEEGDVCTVCSMAELLEAERVASSRSFFPSHLSGY